MAAYKRISRARKANNPWHPGPLPTDSPPEEQRKELSQGPGDWPGFGQVYANLQKAAHKMALSKYFYLSDDHIYTMAVMGCGHEETMRGHQLWCREYGWI